MKIVAMDISPAGVGTTRSGIFQENRKVDGGVGMYVDAHTNSRVVIFGMSPSMIKMLLRASLLAVCGTSGTHAKYPLFI